MDDDATRAICERCGGGIRQTGNIWLHADGLVLCAQAATVPGSVEATRETYWPLRGRTGEGR